MSASVLGNCHSTFVTFTRPADTTAYTAGDVVCNAATLVFPRCARNGSAVLQHAKIVTSANVATKPDLDLWLFDTTIAAVADNAAFAPTDAEMLTLIAVVPFATADFKVGLSGSGGSGNAVCEIKNLGIPLNASTLYGQLVARNAYVPIASEVFKITLGFLD
jgi:hypothetical protein